MQIIGDIFNITFFNPIINILVVIYNGLHSFGVPGALGFSIILLTALVKFITWPLTASQLKSTKKMMDLKPFLDELRKKHKGDKQTLAKAQMDLYKEHGVSPAGGCLPMLLQLPIFISLIQVIPLLFGDPHGLERVNNALYNTSWRITQSPDSNFFGLNLASKPADFGSIGFIVLFIPIVTALLQFVQSAMITPSPVKEYKSDSPKEKKEKEDVEDVTSAMQSQMVYVMPLMLGVFAYSFQLGIALYLNTLTILNIWQQYHHYKFDNLKNFVLKFARKS